MERPSHPVVSLGAGRQAHYGSTSPDRQPFFLPFQINKLQTHRTGRDDVGVYFSALWKMSA